MQRTGIEYLTHTWNPLTMRCTPISEGCANCWHIAVADRLSKNPTMHLWDRAHYAGEKDQSGEIIGLKAKELEAPYRRKKPAIIGVQFMGDLFHESVSFNHIHQVWDAMKACPQHIFVVLTKRPERMQGVVELIYSKERMGWANGFWNHVYLGVTAENQQRADERISVLIDIPAAVHFVSLEPLLGPIDLTHFDPGGMNNWNLLGGKGFVDGFGEVEKMPFECLDWVICGGESGPNARPMHPDWARGLRDQCQEAGVPFFMKQMSGKTKAERNAIPADLMIREYP